MIDQVRNRHEKRGFLFAPINGILNLDLDIPYLSFKQALDRDDWNVWY